MTDSRARTLPYFTVLRLTLVAALLSGCGSTYQITPDMVDTANLLPKDVAVAYLQQEHARQQASTDYRGLWHFCEYRQDDVRVAKGDYAKEYAYMPYDELKINIVYLSTAAANFTDTGYAFIAEKPSNTFVMLYFNCVQYFDDANLQQVLTALVSLGVSIES